MTDQERITDFLCSEKKMTANYDSFASECVNIPLRDEFLRLFNQSHHSQTELFQTAQERGWYSPEQAQIDKILAGLHQILQPAAHRPAVRTGGPRPGGAPWGMPSGPAAVLGRFLPGAVEKQKKIPYNNTIC